MKRIYLDYASLTPIDKRVSKVIKKYSGMDFANPSALYASGVAAKKALESARKKIADILHAHIDEIVFTASGTEANNLALNWVEGGKHIIVSAIEHSSILSVARVLEERGVRVTYIGVNGDGIVDVDEIRKAIVPETVLISVMAVNNEIGTIEPLGEIGKIIRLARKENNSTYPLFHTDACQAICLPLHVEKLGVDLLTLDGHKIYGPRGIGLLYVKRGISLVPIIYGGGQERGLRSGTENIPAIMGMSRALELMDGEREKECKRLSDLKDFFIYGLKEKIPGIIINGSTETTSPHILNVSIPDIDNEFFVLKLDARGIECSTKSACLTDEDESYVVKNIGGQSRTAVRFSFGRQTKKSHLKKVLKAVILEAWNTSRNSK